MSISPWSSALTASEPPPPQPAVLGGYRGLVTAGVDCDFEHGGFPLPGGGFWRYREPDAVVVVEHDRLRVAAVPLTRAHDGVQILDNAKHMYFSRARVLTGEQTETRVDVEIAARIVDGIDDDLYAGFVSVNLLDFETGLAFDWFVANRRAASVYARLPFPGVPRGDGDDEERPRHFCVFHEADVEIQAAERHRYAIAYMRATDTVRFLIDDVEVDRYSDVPVRMGQFLVALGIMTEKPIGAAGSVSLIGQGVIAEWSEVEVRGAAGLRR